MWNDEDIKYSCVRVKYGRSYAIVSNYAIVRGIEFIFIMRGYIEAQTQLVSQIKQRREYFAK